MNHIILSFFKWRNRNYMLKIGFQKKMNSPTTKWNTQELPLNRQVYGKLQWRGVFSDELSLQHMSSELRVSLSFLFFSLYLRDLSADSGSLCQTSLGRGFKLLSIQRNLARCRSSLKNVACSHKQPQTASNSEDCLAHWWVILRFHTVNRLLLAFSRWRWRANEPT